MIVRQGLVSVSTLRRSAKTFRCALALLKKQRDSPMVSTSIAIELPRAPTSQGPGVCMCVNATAIAAKCFGDEHPHVFVIVRAESGQGRMPGR